MACVPSSQATPRSGVRGTPVLALSGFEAIATWVSVSRDPRSVNQLQFPCLTTHLLPAGPADGAGEEAGVTLELQEDVGSPRGARVGHSNKDACQPAGRDGLVGELGHIHTVRCALWRALGRISDTEVTGSLTHHLSCSGTMRIFQKDLPVLHCRKLKRRAAPTCPRRRRCRNRGLLAVGEQQLGGEGAAATGVQVARWPSERRRRGTLGLRPFVHMLKCPRQ